MKIHYLEYLLSFKYPGAYAFQLWSQSYMLKLTINVEDRYIDNFKKIP